MLDVGLFLPVLAQVALTAILAVPTASMRFRAAGTREVHPKDIALGQRNWPVRVQKVSNTFNNQWESPILFYAGAAFAMIAGQSGPVLIALAWTYVASRVAHALIYMTTNFVPLRFLAYIIGFSALIAFWVVLALGTVAA